MDPFVSLAVRKKSEFIIFRYFTREFQLSSLSKNPYVELYTFLEFMVCLVNERKIEKNKGKERERRENEIIILIGLRESKKKKGKRKEIIYL